MKISVNWLRQYVDITLTPKEVADRLTMAGSEVRDIAVIGGHWGGIVVGRITAVNPHPNADRLTLVTIDNGDGAETVVCGAPNVAVGARVAFAPVGSELIDPRTGELGRLKSARIRGVLSSGMACSERELGISEEHEGILILPQDVEVGHPLADYLGDVILNLDVTPNRPDCLSVIGLAREIAALTGQEVHLSDEAYPETGAPIGERVSVDIAAPDLCPRYCASLITGVKIGESPRWLQERLISYGMRPISDIVDITNFVMLEYGQPLHAFDYERITDGRIIVRRARDGETIVSLDGIGRDLSGDMLVIADATRAVAVAGVMGGANSEVHDGTTSILLEAASFSPASIHHTGRTLRMPSEACMRFERGISGEVALPALKRATQLIVDIAGGSAARGIVDVYPGKRTPPPIRISSEDTRRHLGIEFSRGQIESTLSALGFDCQPGSSPSEVVATAPYWRSDIGLTVDLVEEVARIIGYDAIPTTMLDDPIPRHHPEPIIRLKQALSQGLVGLGFQEMVSHALVSGASLAKLSAEGRLPEPAPLRLVNPMTAEQEYLRASLRGTVLGALGANLLHDEGGIRLFELGRVYHARPDDLPDEPETLCAVISGPRQPGSWVSEERAESTLDFFDARGMVEALLGLVGVTPRFEASADDTLHPGRQAAIVRDGVRIGVVGEVHPAVSAGFEIPGTACLFEVYLKELLPLTIGHRMFQSVSRFPAVVRDLAVVVDSGTHYQQVVDIIEGSSLVTKVALFDVYSGDQVPAGKKSLACRVTYQSSTHTLTDDEVNKVQQKLLNRLARDLGAVLRG